jgi:O-acetyl-ADP-ribose deacetylase (regulator of RNase III)
MSYKEIKGDLIILAQQGNFDVIVHGCNCQCIMGAGIAPQMAKAFGCDLFRLEKLSYKGDINKLGQIDYDDDGRLAVVNAYTQYFFGGYNKGLIDLDYDALTLCLRKINHIFAGEHIGLPQIGCGLAGGNWEVVKSIIQAELSNCHVTVVIYNK